MTSATLTRRSNQLALLARACARGCPGKVIIRNVHRDEYHAHTRLLALERDALFVAWPDQPLTSAERSGSLIEVWFDLEQDHYSLSARTRGRRERAFATLGRLAALELSVPLRVERVQRRSDARIPLGDLEPVEARVTAMLDQAVQIPLRLTDISRGGTAGVTDGSDDLPLRVGDPCWMEFTLPGEAQPFELAVRLAHARPAESGRGLALGWVFCPHDDPFLHERNLLRLEHLVALQH